MKKRKRKSSSFYFLQILQKYFLFLFIFSSATFFFGGFFISHIYAEEISYTEVGGDITEDTVWSVDKSPYIATYDIYVDEGATLTIEEGVVVKFDYGNSLFVKGSLVVDGSNDNPVHFTSYYDDGAGGDTDGVYKDCYYLEYDESGVGIGEEFCDEYDYEAEEGDWGFIFIMPSSNISTINNLNMKYSTDGILVHSNDNLFVNNFYSDKSLEIYNSKNISFNVLEIPNIEISNGSSVSINSLKISNENGDGILMYGGSSLDIKDSQISVNDNSILVYDNSSLSGSGLVINGGKDGLLVYNNSNLNISKSKISGASNAGVEVYMNSDENSVSITDSEIFENKYGVFTWGTPIVVNNNSIHGNNYGAYTFRIPEFSSDFSNNFWGDKTGPYNTSSNPFGRGDNVSDYIDFEPFLPYDPLLKNPRNPVILIPGITATYLNRDYGLYDEIWPDLGRLLLSPDDSFLDELILDIDGKQNIEYPMVAGDIIRKMVTVDVFDGLIKEFIDAGYVEGEDLFVFPYDWRFSTESISKLLKNKIEEVVSKTKQDKVDIVAHSMGGLVAKKYIKDYGEEKVDQLIFLGTPQLGAPKAFKVLMYGDHMGYWKLFLGLSSLKAKFISQNMPSVYELLPSSKYLNLNGSYVSNLLDENNPINLDYTGTKNYLIDNGRNIKMFPFAEDLHDSVDYLNLSNMKSYNFVGCGSPTIAKINLKQKDSWIGNLLNKKDDYQIIYTDGDKTVPIVSATGTIGSDIYYVNGITHESLPSAKGVKENIVALLNNEDLIFGDVFKDNDSFCGVDGDIVSNHSPVILHIYDEEGNHTGLDEDGNMEYGVEGVSIDTIEDINYVFLPKGKNYRVVTKATNTGGFSLKIEKQEGEEIKDTYSWTLVPQPSLATTGEIFLGIDYKPENYNLKIDSDGDGEYESNYKEGFDGTEFAEKFTKEEKTRNSHIVGFIPKKEKSENWGGHNFIENIKIDKDKEEKFSYRENTNSILDKMKDKDREVNNNKNSVNNLSASVGFIDFKDNNLFIIIGSSILVILLAIKFIFKIQ